MAEVKTALADFYLLSEWTVEDGVITSPPTTDRQTKTVTVSGIPAGVPILGAAFEATFGSPLSGRVTAATLSRKLDLKISEKDMTVFSFAIQY